MKYRIITNGNNFRIQVRFLLFFWTNMQRPEDLDNKDFGGSMTFKTLDEAKKFVAILTKPKYKKIS